METASDSPPLFPDALSRKRARRRLYMAGQIGGWGVLAGVQIVASIAILGKGLPMAPVKFAGLELIGFAWGAALTHFFRRLIARWGWKRLGWRALVSRVLASSIALGVFWTISFNGFSHGLLRLPQKSPYPIVATIAAYCVNDSVIMLVWLGLYFGYHIYDRFNRVEIEQQRLILTIKEAELRALKSQVNPHFIFNSLNSLRSLIDEDPRRARQAVTQLANLLRYSLQSGQQQTVPFEEELRVVQDYLALEQVRFEEQLRVRFDIAEDTLMVPVPPLLLQTLAENAVKYGIAPQPAGGEIVIAARCEQGVLQLQVSNPGILPPPGGSPSSSTGVGLRNSAERLRLLFGEDARLELITGTPGQVLARVAIPLGVAAFPSA